MLNVTAELERKFVPLIESVCPAAPAVVDGGDSVVTPGTGFLEEGGELLAPELPPQPLKLTMSEISNPFPNFHKINLRWITMGTSHAFTVELSRMKLACSFDRFPDVCLRPVWEI